jgi:hypothetical protein
MVEDQGENELDGATIPYSPPDPTAAAVNADGTAPDGYVVPKSI